MSQPKTVKAAAVLGLGCLLLVLFSGCWGRKEPKTLAVIQSVLYDLGQDQNYRTILEFMDSSGNQSAQTAQETAQKSSQTFVYEAPSVPESVFGEAVGIEKALFAGHNKVRFFSEAFAEADMAGSLDFFMRDHLTDETPFFVVVAGDEPEMIYRCRTGLSDNVGDYIEALASNQPNQLGTAVFVTSLEFSRAYYQDGLEAVAGLVRIVDNPLAEDAQDGAEQPRSDLVYEGLAAFKGNRLAGYLDAAETRAYNFITNNIKAALLSMTVDDAMVVFRVDSSSAEISARAEDGQTTLCVSLAVRLDLLQESGTLDISRHEVQEALEKPLNAMLEESVRHTIEKAQTEFGSDIFGFGSALHIQDPTAWRQLRDNWNETFAGARLTVKVNASIARTGEIKEPLNLEEIGS